MMKSIACLLILAGSSLALPNLIDISGVASASSAVFVTPGLGASNQTATVAPVSSQAAAAAKDIKTDPISPEPSVTASFFVSASLSVAPSSVAMAPNPTDVLASGRASASATAKKRREAVERREGTCEPQPSGHGPVASPDTPDAFASSSTLAALANNAPTPEGYTLVFKNLASSLSASNYMGYYALDTYDTLGCQSICDQHDGCVAFNMYAERAPSVDPNDSKCPDPPSTTVFKCVLWGAPVSQAQANNNGQWRSQFHVLNGASNAYNKNLPPAPISGFDGPNPLGGAINAPLGYMGYKFYPFSQSQGYTPPTCAAACVAQTAFDEEHVRHPDGTYDACNFFNSYVLSKNGVPEGLYCSFYNQSWPAQYGNNYGQYRDSDHYTVSESYSYSVHANELPKTFNLIASGSGTIADGLTLEANTISGYWSGFNIHLLGEPNLPASCQLDSIGTLLCSGHQLVSYSPQAISQLPYGRVFYTAYGGFSDLEVPVTCQIDAASELQCSNSWGASVLQLFNWGQFGYGSTYMLGISNKIEAGAYPVTLKVQAPA